MAHRQQFIATYRIQLSREFTFWDLIARVDYLHALGVSHLYLSPIMQSVTGSCHGYDVTDFAAVSAERGGEDGLLALDAKLRSLSPPMHMILDIVPNHMSASPENRYWRDVLAKGASSRYWKFFDLRVSPGEKIELPVLSAESEILLSTWEISLAHDGREVSVCAPGGRYPVSAETHADLYTAFETAGGASFTEFLKELPSVAVSNVLRRQHYRLVGTAQSPNSTTYRRFFHLSDFVALRMEDQSVFRETHEKLFDLLRKCPSIAGLRVDHIDGLAQPARYLEALSAGAPHVWVEKILTRGEELPPWACNGTTGYEFIDQMNQLMVDHEGLAAIESRWKRIGGLPWQEFSQCATESRAQALAQLFPGEAGRLDGMLGGAGATSVVVKITSDLPVYRLYHGGAQAISAVAWFVPEWQQFTGAVMAKGVEDCAHYRYTPLAALNEVGCLPVLDGDRPMFFDWLQARQRDWPLNLNAASTHDTKRSEDVRHRLYALADMPEAWEDFSGRALSSLASGGRLRTETKLFFLQAVLGVWPLEGDIDDIWRERICSYMQKAAREASLETSWHKPDGAYESELKGFICSALANEAFIQSVGEMMRFIGPAGAVNSLTALTLRVLSTGVPDIYQGTETWNFSLVDPDNRRSVDYDALAEKLAFSSQGSYASVRNLAGAWKNGAIKLWLTHALLGIRREFLETEAGYRIIPLRVSGSREEDLIAYLLQGRRQSLAVMTPRFPGRLLLSDGGLDVSGAEWADTAIHMPYECRAADLLSGQVLPGGLSVQPSKVFAALPVSVLRLVEYPH